MAGIPRGKRALTATERQQRWRAKVRRQRLLAPKLEKLRAKQQRRAEREATVAEATRKASQTLGTKLYGVLYVDPPCDFLVFSRETGMDRHAANHYPVMSLAALAALPLPAAKDCVLYLWAPFNQLGNAVDLIRVWGFTLKTGNGNGWNSGGAGWGKPDLGAGLIVRENLELLLIASRGSPAWPAMGEQYPSLIIAERGEPSEKPEIFAEMIERLWPNTPKLEMFARRPRTGWDQWGNEIELPPAESVEPSP
jgi:N6-adenosine-specific RNA methylase IME4